LLPILTALKPYAIGLTVIQYGFEVGMLLQAETLRRVWDYLNRKLTLGNIQVSIASLLIGLTVFVLTIIIARAVSALLQRRISTRAQLDPGIRYTIARLTNYLLLTVGLLIALKQAFNIDLTSIAVVFTALSVGIGFGLQYIAADIASGFILLFERPIRVGDRITIEQDEGDVQSIRLRTTIVYTNDQIAIIVPNSRLVSQRVINWSYAGRQARIAIPVSVAPNSDIDQVTKTLLEAAKEVERVLTDPPPTVQFLKFGDYSLDFRLLVWTDEPSRHPQIRSDINYRLAGLFRERGVETARPVHEFRMGSFPPAVDNTLSLMPHDPSTEREPTLKPRSD
jgi:potassium efflux system protein